MIHVRRLGARQGVRRHRQGWQARGCLGRRMPREAGPEGTSSRAARHTGSCLVTPWAANRWQPPATAPCPAASCPGRPLAAHVGPWDFPGGLQGRVRWAAIGGG